MKLGWKSNIPYWYLLLAPVFMYFLGATMNEIVMAANNGQMPVLIPGGCPDGEGLGLITHTCLTSATRLKFLADWIILGNGSKFSVASPGDLLLWGGNYSFWPGLTAWVCLMIRKFQKR